MQHMRTTLRPASGGVFTLIAAALILGAAIYTQANLLFWGFGLVAGAVVVSALWSACTMRSLTVERSAPTHAVAGETLRLRYTLKQKAWLPLFAVTLTESVDGDTRVAAPPSAWALHVPPRGEVQMEAPTWPRRRGTLTLGEARVSSSFPFGVVRRGRRYAQAQRVVVFPALFRLRRGLLPRLTHPDPSGQFRTHRAGGHDEFFGLRQYRYGDSPRVIDWKHSAKTGQMVVREMTQGSPPKLLVLLDLSEVAATEAESAEAREAEQLAEQAISLAASVLCDGYLRGFKIGLAVVGVRALSVPVHHSRPHRTRLLETLTGLDLKQRGDVSFPATMRPSVVIRPGVVASPNRSLGATVLTGRDLERYIQGDAPTSDLLREPARTTREAIEFEDAAAGPMTEGAA